MLPSRWGSSGAQTSLASSRPIVLDVAFLLDPGAEIAQGAVDRCGGPELDPLDRPAMPGDECRVAEARPGASACRATRSGPWL